MAVVGIMAVVVVVVVVDEHCFIPSRTGTPSLINIGVISLIASKASKVCNGNFTQYQDLSAEILSVNIFVISAILDFILSSTVSSAGLLLSFSIKTSLISPPRVGLQTSSVIYISA